MAGLDAFFSFYVGARLYGLMHIAYKKHRWAEDTGKHDYIPAHGFHYKPSLSVGPYTTDRSLSLT